DKKITRNEVINRGISQLGGVCAAVFVDDPALRRKEHSISSLPRPVGKIRILYVSRVVDFVESPQSQKLLARVGTGPAARGKYRNIFTLFVHSIRRRMTNVNAPENQRAKGLSSFFSHLGVVVTEYLRSDSKDVRVLKSLQEWTKKALFHDDVIVQEDNNLVLS